MYKQHSTKEWFRSLSICGSLIICCRLNQGQLQKEGSNLVALGWIEDLVFLFHHSLLLLFGVVVPFLRLHYALSL